MAAPVRALVLAVMVALVAAAPRAYADEARVEELLVAGEDLFDEQEYEKVIRVLRPVLSDTATTRAQRLRALELTALSQFILGDEAAARASFERLLDVDPGYQLRDRSGSPRIRTFFDQVKREVVPGFDAERVAELDHAAPPSATAGRRLELDVRATRGAEHVKEVVLLVRRRGEQDYRAVAGGFRGDARWRIRLTPEASRDAYAIEYYVEGRGLTGEVVARIASPEAPRSIAITAGGAGATGRPWHRRWYVWAGAGGAAVLITGAVILATSGTDDGTLPPGRVTVTP